jgi:peptidoglycan/LPS O-acetylase OafA/YrhL
MGVLRLVLALTVLNWHYAVTPYYYNFIFSRAAVFVFMMISGFYIAMVLNEKYGWSVSGVLTFYSNRILRLMPPYWVVLVACILFEPARWFEELSPWFQFNNVLLFPQGLWANLTLTRAESGYLHLGQMYTVALEIMFYAVAPFILFRSTRLLAGLLLATAALNGGLWLSGVEPVAWQYDFFPAVLMYFLLGALTYRFYLFVKDWPPAELIGYAALPLLITFGVLSRSARAVMWTNHISIYLFYAQCAASIPFIFIASRRWKTDRIIGDLSYPLYIVHVPAIWIVEATPWLGGKEDGGLSVLVLSFGFAGMLFLLVDTPIERWRKQIGEHCATRLRSLKEILSSAPIAG